MCRTLVEALADDSVTRLQPDESARILARIQPQIAQRKPPPWTTVQRALLSAAVLLVAFAAWRIVQRPAPEVATTPADTTQTATVQVPMLEIAAAWRAW